MKRVLTVIALCVMTFWSSHTLMARDFGVVGGASFTNIKGISADKATGYHAGFTWKFHLPLGFAIQPYFLYNMKASIVETAVEMNSSLDMNIGYAEVPVSFQWGPDLLLFRPFFDVTPFVGYAVNNDFKYNTGVKDAVKTWTNDWSKLNRVEYGLGLGFGLEIWKLQVVARYNWNFGPLFNSEGKTAGFAEFVDNSKMAVLENANFGGVTLTAAILF